MAREAITCVGQKFEGKSVRYGVFHRIIATDEIDIESLIHSLTTIKKLHNTQHK